MSKQQIKMFIKELCYDLETLGILIDCDRLKETIPIVCKILFDISTFKEQIKDEPLKNCFPEHGQMDDVRVNIENSFKNGTIISDIDLKTLKYVPFVENFRAMVYDGIKELKRKIKSPLQKKIEIFLPILIAVFVLAFINIKNYVPPNSGLKEDYYLGANFEKYLGTDFSKCINFETVTDMAPVLPRTDMISIRWQGFLLVPQDDQYTFSIIIDDGARLFIDDKNIIDQWGIHASEEFSNSIFLKKGPHKIRLDYFNYTGGAAMKLFWACEGRDKKIIPTRFLRQKSAH